MLGVAFAIGGVQPGMANVGVPLFSAPVLEPAIGRTPQDVWPLLEEGDRALDSRDLRGALNRYRVARNLAATRAAANSGDSGARHDLLAALQRLAKVQVQLGDKDAADDLLGEADAVGRDLMNLRPDEALYWYDWLVVKMDRRVVGHAREKSLRTDENVRLVFQVAGQLSDYSTSQRGWPLTAQAVRIVFALDQAETTRADSLELAQAQLKAAADTSLWWLAREPEQASWLSIAAYAYLGQGIVRAMQGRPDDAVAALQSGKALMARLLKLKPGDPLGVFGQGNIDSQLGLLLAVQGDLPAAQGLLELAVTTLDTRIPGISTDRYWRTALLESRGRLADLLTVRGIDDEAALRQAHAAVFAARDMSRTWPDDPNLTRQHAYGEYLIGKLLLRRNDPARALDSLQSSIEFFESAAHQQPEDLLSQILLADSHRLAGDAEARFERLDDALAHYRVARELGEPLARARPADPRVQETMLWIYGQTAFALEQQGDTHGSVSAMQAGLPYLRRLTDLQPQRGQLRRAAIEIQMHLGDKLTESRYPADALPLLRQARLEQVSLSTDEPQDVDHQLRLVQLDWRIAMSLVPTVDDEERRELLNDAVRRLEVLDRAGRLPETMRAKLDECRFQLHKLD